MADGKGLKGNDDVVLTVKEGMRPISIHLLLKSVCFPFPWRLTTLNNHEILFLYWPSVRFCKVFLPLSWRTDYRLSTSGKRNFRLIGPCSSALNHLATLMDKLSPITQGDCLCLETNNFLNLQMKTVLISWSYIWTWISPSLPRKIRYRTHGRLGDGKKYLCLYLYLCMNVCCKELKPLLKPHAFRIKPEWSVITMHVFTTELISLRFIFFGPTGAVDS